MVDRQLSSTRATRAVTAVVLYRRLIGHIASIVTIVSLSGCSSSGNYSVTFPQSATDQQTLDQQIFESAELNGGEFSVVFLPPYGGGNMVANRNFFYSLSSGGLHLSPLEAGPEIELPVITPLDVALPLPGMTPTRVLHAGKLLLLPATAPQRISYDIAGIREDDLGDDGETVLLSELYFDYREVALSGPYGRFAGGIDGRVST
jgi:hypothetical protein